MHSVIIESVIGSVFVSGSSFNKPLVKCSVATLKRTGAPFLQNGPCSEVTPKLSKCRECKMTPNQRSKKIPNIFCRFYAFRRYLHFAHESCPYCIVFLVYLLQPTSAYSPPFSTPKIVLEAGNWWSVYIPILSQLFVYMWQWFVSLVGWIARKCMKKRKWETEVHRNYVHYRKLFCVPGWNTVPRELWLLLGSQSCPTLTLMTLSPGFQGSQVNQTVHSSATSSSVHMCVSVELTNSTWTMHTHKRYLNIQHSRVFQRCLWRVGTLI